MTTSRYFGITVTVIARLAQLAIIEWAGRWMLVETSDLEGAANGTQAKKIALQMRREHEAKKCEVHP